ncbi:MAG: hypothetical protein JW827_10315 [Spirochaetes bacterium]|nr:hypothetical protein [Spirochaetota bacterium]
MDKTARVDLNFSVSGILNKGGNFQMKTMSLLFFILFLLFTSFLFAQEYYFVNAFGTNTIPYSKFTVPAGITVDHGGHIYVANKTNPGHVLKLDPMGTVILTISNLANPYDVVLDEMDNIYVSESSGLSIKKFDPMGTYITQWSTTNNPYGLAIRLATQELFAVINPAHTLQKFQITSGMPAGFLGSPGMALGEFQFPRDVAIHPLTGEIYVADTGNNRIQKFNSMETPQYELPGFLAPEGVAVDLEGSIFVADTGNNKIKKYGPGGNFIMEWGNPGIYPGEFQNPKGIAVDLIGDVYVVDSGNLRIQKFSRGIQNFLTNMSIMAFQWNLVGISRWLFIRDVPFNFPPHLLGNSFIYEWCPMIPYDEYMMQYRVPDILDIGTGYWIYSDRNTMLDFFSEPTYPTNTFQKPLPPGWNLVTSPFTFSCNKIKINTFSQGIREWDAEDHGQPVDPIILQYIEPVIWAYDGAGYYEDGRLRPWKGAWIWVHQFCELWIKGTDQTAENKSKIYTRSTLQEAVNFDWLARIGFHMGDRNDTFNFIGTVQGESFHMNKAPQVPDKGARVEIGKGYSYDIKSSVRSIKSWDIKISGEKAYLDGRMEYDLGEIQMAGLCCLLSEKYTGEVVARGGKGAATVEGGKYGINKEYVLKVATLEYADLLSSRVEVKNLKTYPNPHIKGKHKFLKLSYTLTEDSHMEFTLYDISGEKIYGLNAEEVLGLNKLIDIPVDPLGSGVYICVLKAKSLSSGLMVIKKSRVVIIN